MESLRFPRVAFINANDKERLKKLVECMEEEINNLKNYVMGGKEIEEELVHDFRVKYLRVVSGWFEEIKAKQRLVLFDEEKESYFRNNASFIHCLQTKMVKRMKLIVKAKRRHRNIQDWLRQHGKEVSHLLVKLLWLMMMFEIEKRQQDDDDNHYQGNELYKLLIERVESRVKQIGCYYFYKGVIISKFLHVLKEAQFNRLISPFHNSPPINCQLLSSSNVITTVSDEVLSLIIDQIWCLHNIFNYSSNYNNDIASKSQTSLDLIKEKINDLMNIGFGKVLGDDHDHDHILLSQIPPMLIEHINIIWGNHQNLFVGLYPYSRPSITTRRLRIERLLDSMTKTIRKLKSLQSFVVFKNKFEVVYGAIQNLDIQVVEYLQTKKPQNCEEIVKKWRMFIGK
ncbi:hypothetical protein CsatB_000770 [Cannabis sativa]